MLRISLILVTGALLLGAASAQKPRTYVYVESNIGTVPDQNSIYAFGNNGRGKLISLAGSPYLTGGTGVQAPGSSELNADQELTANATGTALYGVNGHTNTIAAFTVNADGTLTTIPGSPYDSGGQNPISIGTSGKFLVVANKNFDPNQNIDDAVPNYTTFSVKRNGGLAMNPGSTIDLAAGSGPSQALVSGRGHLLFGLELFTSRIACYSYDRAGLMTETSSIGPIEENGAFLGEILHPSQRVLYACNLTSTLGVYSFDSDGVISFVTSVANEGIDICWLRLNAAGTRLYSSESVTNSLTVYDTTDALNPVQLQHVTLNAPDGFVINIELDPTEEFLYALAGHGIHVLNVDASGMLSETVSPAIIPTSSDDTPLGLAVIRK
jgi:6-phosphogluconolactonase (cycloisomerase 2 family)